MLGGPSFALGLRCMLRSNPHLELTRSGVGGLPWNRKWQVNAPRAILESAGAAEQEGGPLEPISGVEGVWRARNRPPLDLQYQEWSRNFLPYELPALVHP